ncbi:UPF0704 protein C6orf165 [Gonapodya prolifera JEL478]|uniref:Cilia- and flagella-associated protein 206 n=1 Tax=Gonapodya prolifera (strain JEL478) TaxID=1344416 RepID=A0A139A715_GONPJ|nr:UPF0704 protein C6orf165 [Gonapodya prolifera JEL478]|eukprot:KXS12612.1 UPF0704 protein C6orf165 [Gonapodya prolifera JEL478]
MASGLEAQSTSPVGGTTVSETLAAFTVRSVVLDPRNGFNVEHELSRSDVERLIQLSVDAITSTDSPSNEAVKMQVYFDTSFPAQGDFLGRERQVRLAQTANIVKEICDARVKAVPMLEVLYRKIISYILMRTKMGAPTDIKVVRETTAALESVFPQSELSTFLHLDRTAKEAQLNGLAQLVAGIRLFNRALGKGGEGIDPLPELCGAEIAEASKRPHPHRAPLLPAIIAHLHANPPEIPTPYQPIPPSKLLLAQIIASSTFHRQLLIYLDALSKQVREGERTAASLAQRFSSTVAELKAACRARTAVPVDQVYPHFLSLAALWTGYRDELFLVAFRKSIVDTMQHHAGAFAVTVPPDVQDKAKGLAAPPLEPAMVDDDTIATRATSLMTVLTPLNRELQVLHPLNTTAYHQIRCEVGGFCPVTLVDRGGLVVPGDRALGLVRYRDRCYAFASREAVERWARDPEKYIQGSVDLAKQHPSLIQLCHLYHYFPTVDALEKAKWYAKAKHGLGKLAMVAEVGSQVDTHIMDSNIDTKYQWNEWELRRRALVLVNLKTKRTHSTQTTSSTFRRDSETQHYEPKASSTQTVKDSSTQVVKKSQYLAGLRGDGKAKFAVVDLTLDL